MLTRWFGGWILAPLWVGLGLAVELAAAQDVEEDPASSQEAVSEDVPELPGMHFSLPPLEHYREIVERPLFMPDRKPQKPEEQAEVTAPGPVNPLQVRLLGTIITPQKREALIEDTVAGRVLHLAPGMPIQDWQVKEIKPDRVVLVRQGQPQELLLRTYNEPQAAIPKGPMVAGRMPNVPRTPLGMPPGMPNVPGRMPNAIQPKSLPQPAIPQQLTPAQRRILERRYERRQRATR
jgi:hypothetical protein